MFEKLVSRLSFSPATVGELARYASYVKRRARLYGYGLAITAALLICQVIITLAPIAPGNASSADPVSGGFTSKDSMMLAYQQNTEKFGDTVAALGISGDTLASSEFTSLSSPHDYSFTTSRTPLLHPQALLSTNGGTIYQRLLSDAAYPRTAGWLGSSEDTGKFFVVQRDGAVLTEKRADVDSQTPGIERTITGPDEPLSPGDTAHWTLNMQNTSPFAITTQAVISVRDLLDYATVTPTDDAHFSLTEKTVSWPQITLKPGQKMSYDLKATINSQLSWAPPHPNDVSDNCVVTLNFGDDVNTPIICPLPKQLALASNFLPPISPASLTAVSGVLFLLSLILYLRDRQYINEIRIIRRQLNTGGF